MILIMITKHSNSFMSPISLGNSFKRLSQTTIRTNFCNKCKSDGREMILLLFNLFFKKKIELKKLRNEIKNSNWVFF